MCFYCITVPVPLSRYSDAAWWQDGTVKPALYYFHAAQCSLIAAAFITIPSASILRIASVLRTRVSGLSNWRKLSVRRYVRSPLSIMSHSRWPGPMEGSGERAQFTRSPRSICAVPLRNRARRIHRPHA